VLVGHDWGARAAYAATALAPHRISGLVALSVGYGAHPPAQPPSFDQARAYWYQWYFGHALGRAALAADRRGFCRLLWTTWSPGWSFREEDFDVTAQSFENPDFVDVAVHCYRHRWGGVPGDPRYGHAQKLLAALPAITAATTVLHGANDQATLTASTEGCEHLFRGSYVRRVLPGIGHFIPRECPDVVLEAILERADAAPG
jgi:pimeloyl-ACP methyl ester carboxylesterase